MAVTDFEKLVDRYIAVWNETDAESRSAQIRSLWTEDGEHVFPQAALRGYEAIEAVVTEVYEQFVTKGFKFRVGANGKPDVNNNSVRFTWEMVPAAGGDEVSMGGVDFIIVDEDGRIRYDYQFFDILPA
ncbi:hypothetical protein GCM10010193_15900 [Kitasatospora atroaurantiaca]